MARFITVHQQQNIQTQSSFLHYLLLVVIMMEFIPLPDIVPSSKVGPIYLVVWLCFLVIAFNFNKLATLSPLVLKLILLLLVYNVYVYVLNWGLNILDDKSNITHPILAARKCIELLVFSLACTNLAEIKRVLFTITIAIAISTVFGLLVHHFGEPFQGVRDWLLQSKALYLKRNFDTEIIPGKGARLTGLSGTGFYFGYLMSAGPAIVLICARLSRFKWLWAVIFLSMCYALYLNGERAAFLGAFLGIVALLIHWRLISIPYTCVVIAFLLSVYIFSLSSSQTTSQKIEQTPTLMDRFQAKEDYTKKRLTWWTNGIVSVIEHPLVGAQHEEYLALFYSDKHIIIKNHIDKHLPISHNSYINPGIKIGVIGWIVVLLYLAMLKSILMQVFTAVTKEKREKIIFEGVSIAVPLPMLNAMFQNESIFTGEPANLCLTGLLISCYQILYNRNYLSNLHDYKK